MPTQHARAQSQPAPPLPSIDLQDRLHDVQIQRRDGSLIVQMQHEGQARELTAEQYLAAIEHAQNQQRQRGWLFVIFNITTWFGVIWVSVGLLGQVMFTGRMLVQWLVSEKEKRSVVPPAFWWMSIIGASMLILYFIWRKDIVGVLGQATGWLIYVRNLWMIHKPNHGQVSVTMDPAPEPELD